MANRPAKGEQNLFTGILYNAFDRSPMHLRSVTPSSKGKKRRRYSYLSSLEYKHGKPLGADGRFSRSIDCHAVERAVRSMIDELRPADISGRGEVGPGDEDIRRETEQLVALGQKEKMYKDKVRDPMTPVGALPTYFYCPRSITTTPRKRRWDRRLRLNSPDRGAQVAA